MPPGTAWADGPDRLRLVAHYKNTFKPAAFDFGLAGESGGEEDGLLEPETGASYEVGLKGRLMGARLSYEIMSFLMNFENLVLAQSIDGLPSLTNGGSSDSRESISSSATRFPATCTRVGPMAGTMRDSPTT
ncbi:MAG TPA: hypothetical protein VLK65_10245 [Vicinamibacteria bacterium]|nr:hypothetical protein [Vicinamibacteria bacterium]